MRYVVLALLGIFGVILSGSFDIGIAGIQVDLILIMVVAIALLEKGYLPVLFAALAGLFMDIMFSTVMGLHAFCYTAVAALVQLLMSRMKRMGFLMVFASGAGGYILKEVIMGCLVYILGSRFSFTNMLVRYILPAALLSGVLLIVAYFLMGKLFRKNWMRPRARHGMDDFGRI